VHKEVVRDLRFSRVAALATLVQDAQKRASLSSKKKKKESHRWHASLLH
jgi:hypothetical protein